MYSIDIAAPEERLLRLNRVSSTVGQYDIPTHTTAGHLERILEEQQGPVRD